MVELHSRQKFVLLKGGVERDAIGPGHRSARQVACPQPDHPLLTGAGQQVDVHHPGRAGDSGLTAQLRSGGWRETKTLAPGHGGRKHDRPSLAAELLVVLDLPQEPVGPPLAGAVGAVGPPPAGADRGTNPRPLCTEDTTPRPFTVC